MGKGTDYERKLASTLDEAGWGVVRSGGSGSGTKDNRPDIIAGDGQRVWVIEAKYSSGPRIYLDPEEVEQITSLATSLRAEPVVAPRWHSRKVDGVEADWYPISPYVLPETPSGNFSIKAHEVIEKTVPLSDRL